MNKSRFPGFGNYSRPEDSKMSLETTRGNFVLADGRGLEVDVHAITLTRRETESMDHPDKGELYPAASLTGAGRSKQET